MINSEDGRLKTSGSLDDVLSDLSVAVNGIRHGLMRIGYAEDHAREIIMVAVLLGFKGDGEIV